MAYPQRCPFCKSDNAPVDGCEHLFHHPAVVTVVRAPAAIPAQRTPEPARPRLTFGRLQVYIDRDDQWVGRYRDRVKRVDYWVFPPCVVFRWTRRP